MLQENFHSCMQLNVCVKKLQLTVAATTSVPFRLVSSATAMFVTLNGKTPPPHPIFSICCHPSHSSSISSLQTSMVLPCYIMFMHAHCLRSMSSGEAPGYKMWITKGGENPQDARPTKPISPRLGVGVGVRGGGRLEHLPVLGWCLCLT